MGKRLVGYVTDQSLTLFSQDEGGWKELASLSPKDASGQLKAYLDRNTSLHLLADVIEMEFRVEAVTFIRGRAGRELRERKLLQTFRATPYRHVFTLGRDAQQKTQEKLLLTAITNPELIEPWVAPLRLNRLPLSGIASVPLLQGRLLHAFGISNPHAMLVTVQANRSIRVSYFLNGELRFSRLTNPVPETERLNKKAFEEAARTHQYLLSLRMVDRNYSIDVACLTLDDEVDEWRAEQPSSGLLNFHHMGYQSVSQSIGLKVPMPVLRVDDLYMALLAKARFPNHFAPNTERHDYQLLWLRHGLVVSSLLIGGGGISTSAFWMNELLGLRHSAQEAQHMQAAADAQSEQVRESFPKTELPVIELRELLSLEDQTRKEHIPTRLLLSDLSKGFDAVPQVELMEISWAVIRTPETFKEHGLAVDEGAGQEVGEKVWAALLTCDVLNAANYASANERANELKRAIEGNGEKIQVGVVSYPFNTLSVAELKEDDVGAKIPARLPFKIRAVWKKP